MITRARAAFAFIFITVLLDMLAFANTVPKTPKVAAAAAVSPPSRCAMSCGKTGTTMPGLLFIRLGAPLQGGIGPRASAEAAG